MLVQVTEIVPWPEGEAASKLAKGAADEPAAMMDTRRAWVNILKTTAIL